jgi:hypothetical protein
MAVAGQLYFYLNKRTYVKTDFLLQYSYIYNNDGTVVCMGSVPATASVPAIAAFPLYFPPHRRETRERKVSRKTWREDTISET